MVRVPELAGLPSRLGELAVSSCQLPTKLVCSAPGARHRKEAVKRGSTRYRILHTPAQFRSTQGAKTTPLPRYCAFTFWKNTSCSECVCPEIGSRLLIGSVIRLRASPHPT